MRIEDTSWTAERARYGTEFRAARYKRWFKRDSDGWIFAGTMERMFLVDTKTAASIYARGIDIEFDAVYRKRLSFNLLLTLPFAALGMVPLYMLIQGGITDLWLTAGIVYLTAAVILSGFTDWKLAFRQRKLRRQVTEELIASGVPRWRSIQPLHPRIFLFDAAMILVWIGALTSLVLALLDVMPLEMLSGLILVILAPSWLLVVWIERVKRELDQETDELRGKQVASDHVVGRLGKRLTR